MKQIWISAHFLAGVLLCSNIASAKPEPIEILEQMSHASRSLNYEFAYVSVSKRGIESLRYRHAVIDKQPVVQLLHMDGSRREVLQRGSEISYFEPGLEPFTLLGDHIVDALPAIVFADFKRLTKFYDFIFVGQSRITDRLCEGYRIVARDRSRYSYVVWVDSDTKLPLWVELLDHDGGMLEQYRVISAVVGDQVKNVMPNLFKSSLPPLLSLPDTESAQLNWAASWLPAGVNEMTRYRRKLPNVLEPIESIFYSDGLFSFSVNISPSGSNGRQSFYRHGSHTIRTEIRNSHEITVIGELPPLTAKRIADNISFKVLAE